ncbi:alpha/beta hydrolase [Hydrogenophaga crassostreae]|uniref:Alpha/beta hydrolase n=1 Tax=Hydrogenophaga crassostreae TaxID=1763535 RepID=A0A167GUD0_9BURK|nr:alpha/beta fold hydrolase [Hydrogenophaga crassostreae]AOW15268.1 alpha/beta hydrolase [Hydrogenophaga crassostreae]OAD39893.1 alpha/beta hydrolase [Hydrogenophaga crassostreae]
MNTLPAFTTLGSGPTVLMLHGIGGGHTAFAPQVETLASAGYRAVSWDMPGYGRSAPIEPYTFKGLAQRALDLIDALQCDSVTLVGHSMGGMVAQELMARRPDRINRLVLCGTSAAFGKRTDGRLDAGWADQFVSQRTAPLDAGQTMEQMAQKLIPQMVGPGALPEGLRLAEFCMANVPPSTYRRALQALVTFDRQQALADIRVPTLLIAGEFDRNASPSVMRHMAEAMPRARFVELLGAGHLMNLEAPDRFDALLLDFLAEPLPEPLPGAH